MESMDSSCLILTVQSAAAAAGGGFMMWRIFLLHILGPNEHHLKASPYQSTAIDQVRLFMTIMYSSDS